MSLLKKRKHHRFRVNLTGAWYSSRNAGDQAILISIRELLEARLAELQLEVICARDDFVREEHGIEAVSQTKNLFRVLRHVVGARALLIGGGTPFYDDLKHMTYLWVLAHLCKLTGGKLIIYAASAQELRQCATRLLTRSIVNLADLVTVRESITKHQFETVLEVRTPVVCTTDPAIALRPCSEKRVREILEQEGLGKGQRPMYALCPHFFSNTETYRVHHYEKFSDEVIERQIDTLARTAEYIATLGRVVFLPMNVDPPDSDLNIFRAIRERLQNLEDIVFVETQYRPREIAGILSRCKLVIGVRLHALVMAAAVRTPFIAVSYAPKVVGFVKLLGEEKHSLRLQDLSFDSMRQRIDDYLVHYEHQSRMLAEHVAQLQRKASENADCVAALLRP